MERHHIFLFKSCKVQCAIFCKCVFFVGNYGTGSFFLKWNAHNKDHSWSSKWGGGWGICLRRQKRRLGDWYSVFRRALNTFRRVPVHGSQFYAQLVLLLWKKTCAIHNPHWTRASKFVATIPLMLLASSLNTSIHNSMFYLLAFASARGWADAHLRMLTVSGLGWSAPAPGAGMTDVLLLTSDDTDPSTSSAPPTATSSTPTTSCPHNWKVQQQLWQKNVKPRIQCNYISKQHFRLRFTQKKRHRDEAFVNVKFCVMNVDGVYPKKTRICKVHRHIYVEGGAAGWHLKIFSSCWTSLFTIRNQQGWWGRWGPTDVERNLYWC